VCSNRQQAQRQGWIIISSWPAVTSPLWDGPHGCVNVVKLDVHVHAAWPASVALIPYCSKLAQPNSACGPATTGRCPAVLQLGCLLLQVVFLGVLDWLQPNKYLQTCKGIARSSNMCIASCGGPLGQPILVFVLLSCHPSCRRTLCSGLATVLFFQTCPVRHRDRPLCRMPPAPRFTSGCHGTACSTAGWGGTLDPAAGNSPLYWPYYGMMPVPGWHCHLDTVKVPTGFAAWSSHE